MRNISLNIYIVIFITLLSSGKSWAQLEPFGLEGKEVTSLSISSRDYYIGNYLICAGTDSGGVHVRELDAPDSQWVNMGFEDKWIASVHIHHWGFGPIERTTIAVGFHPDSYDSISLYKMTYGLDSTWIPIDLRGQVVDRPGICAIESFHYTGHNPLEPIFIQVWDWVYRSWDWETWEYVHYGGGWVMETHQAWQPWGSRIVWIGGETEHWTPYLVKSLDKGETWESSGPGYIHPMGRCVALAIDPHDPDIVYASTSISGLMKTTDGGPNWFYLPLNIQAFGLEVDPGNPEHLVAAGSPPHYFSIYESYDAGESWIPIVIDSTLSPVISCVADTIDGEFVVYLGTDGDGVYRYRSSSTQVEFFDDGNTQLPFSLYQNYPNPFNTSTTIPYQLYQPSKVNISIYNIIGQHIIELVNEYQDAGYHLSSWDGKNQSDNEVASGLYLCRIKFGRHEKMIRMLFLK
jgi:hypothetical protein